MDPTALSMHLASYSYNGAPLFGQIEPEPVAVTGNLLGFVMRGDEDMSFGGADLPNLWETVAQDLWMVCVVSCSSLNHSGTGGSLTAHVQVVRWSTLLYFPGGPQMQILHSTAN